MPFTGDDAVAQFSPTATSTLAFDNPQSVSGGHDGGEPDHNRGIYGQDSVGRGLVIPNGSAETILQAGTLLTGNSAITAIGGLPNQVGTIQAGPIDDSSARQYTDTYIDTTTVTCELEGLVGCDYEWVALHGTHCTIATADVVGTVSSGHFAWHGATAAIDGSSYKVQSIEISNENNLAIRASLDGTAATANREGEWAESEGSQVSVDATIRVPLGVDFTADTLSTLAVTLTAKSNDAVPRTLTCVAKGNGLHLTENPMELSGGGDAIEYSISAESEFADTAAFTASIA